MNDIAPLAFERLAFILIPVICVLAIYTYWSMSVKKPILALARMLGQLLLIGYVLTFLFSTSHQLIILAVLLIMLLASSWIALDASNIKRLSVLPIALSAIVLGGLTTLIIVTQVVLQLSPWYLPSVMIPMAGMILAASMNSISLSLERYLSEKEHNVPSNQAVKTAFSASMIPNVNALLAVGLVSLPGMMTGQILSGVSPLIAVRYQILVMCMIFSASGLSSFIFLTLFSKHNK